MKTPEEIVKALRWLAMETEFVFGKEQLTEAADLIESLQAEVGAAHTREDAAYAALAESQRREKAAVKDLETAQSCITCAYDFACEYSNSCGCSTADYKWRGPEEEDHE